MVKLAGAAYLVYLGVQTLFRRGTRARTPPARPPRLRARPLPSMRTAYLQGLISTVLNPKPALLFLTYLPQFIDESRAVAAPDRVPRRRCTSSSGSSG